MFEKLIIKHNDLKSIDSILDLSEAVFRPSPKEKELYHNKQDWLQKINDNGLLLTALIDDNIAGYALCYPKGEGIHIWNVGVSSKYRRKGIWKELYKTILTYAHEQKYPYITLNTYEDEFPNMYAFCQDNGFTRYKLENGKSYFRKKLT